MRCHNCGKEIDFDANFCKYCGAKFVETETKKADLQENASSARMFLLDCLKSAKNKITHYIGNKKPGYYVCLTLIFVLFVLVLLCKSVPSIYDSADLLQKSNQYELAYKKIKYVHLIAPYYKDTNKIYDKCKCMHYYAIGTNTNFDDIKRETNLKKALQTDWANNNEKLKQVIDGYIYSIWCKRAINVAQYCFQKSELISAAKLTVEAELYFNNTKKLLLNNEAEHKNLKDLLDLYEKTISDLKSIISKRRNDILKLHAQMKIVKDDFDRTLQIYDYQVSDMTSILDDCMYLDIVQYKNDSTPRLYLMVINVNYQKPLNANRIIFNIDDEIRDLQLVKSSKVFDKQYLNDFNVEKYQVLCNETLVKELAKAKIIKVRLVSEHENADRELRAKEIQAIKRTYEYFNLFARYGNTEDRIKELKKSELFDRYIKSNLPKRYLTNEQIPQSEFTYTIRYDLFNLYKFQKLSKNKRIIEFEDENTMNTISDQIIGFVDNKQIYKIADNYCIVSKEINNESFKYNRLKKTACDGSEIGIEKLPYKKCEWFTRTDKDGEYYLIYDVDGLWKEFDKKGTQGVENELQKEVSDYYKKQNIVNHNVDTTAENYNIESKEKVDFSSYMKRTEKTIKKNWKSPKNNKSYRITVLFKIAKNGQLLLSKVTHSSGFKDADEAALRAIENSAPFNPLPDGYKGESAEINFTFEYNHIK